jgi:hypothetical protein
VLRRRDINKVEWRQIRRMVLQKTKGIFTFDYGSVSQSGEVKIFVYGSQRSPAVVYESNVSGTPAQSLNANTASASKKIQDSGVDDPAAQNIKKRLFCTVSNGAGCIARYHF